MPITITIKYIRYSFLVLKVIGILFRGNDLDKTYWTCSKYNFDQVRSMSWSLQSDCRYNISLHQFDSKPHSKEKCFFFCTPGCYSSSDTVLQAHIVRLSPAWYCILGGNSKLGAHVSRNLCYLICSRHLIGSMTVENFDFFYEKTQCPSWSPCSELPSNTGPVMSPVT